MVQKITVQKIIPIVIWFLLAGGMVTFVILAHPNTEFIALAFLAWCGGVASTATLYSILFFLARRKSQRARVE